MMTTIADNSDVSSTTLTPPLPPPLQWVNNNPKTTKKPDSWLQRLLKRLAKTLHYGQNDAPVELKSVLGYLKRFGYIAAVKRLIREGVNHRVSAHRTRRKKPWRQRTSFGKLLREDIKSMADIIRTALKLFQRFMRITVTGEPDKDTLTRMNRPRCGGKDMGEQRMSPNYMTLRDRIKNYLSLKLNETGLWIDAKLQKVSNKLHHKSRPKRHVLAGSRWKIKNITYKITKYPSKFRTNAKKHIIDEQIARAFKYWSDVSNLNFIRMPASTPAKDVIIDIRWENGEHGDGDPLDGVGKVLAHSYFPQYGGDAHFDDDEIWTVDVPEGSNILVTSIHELGHSLGLDHSDVSDSLMNPVYPPYRPNWQLSQDDIRAIHILYGPRPGVAEIPNLCNPNMTADAVYKPVNSTSIFVMIGQHYWRIKSDEMTIDSEYPKPIGHKFPGLDDGNLNAAIELPDTSIMVFKNSDCYKFIDDKLVPGFPAKCKQLYPSLPAEPSAVVQLDGYIYAFNGAEYWTYIVEDSKKSPTEINALNEKEAPKPIVSKWPKVPDNVDAVLNMKQSIYFFKGDLFYRLSRFNNQFKPTDSLPPYPRKISMYWFGCS